MMDIRLQIAIAIGALESLRYGFWKLRFYLRSHKAFSTGIEVCHECHRNVARFQQVGGRIVCANCSNRSKQ